MNEKYTQAAEELFALQTEKCKEIRKALEGIGLEIAAVSPVDLREYTIRAYILRPQPVKAEQK